MKKRIFAFIISSVMIAGSVIPAMASEEAVLEDGIIEEAVIDENVSEEDVMEEGIIEEDVLDDTVIEEAVYDGAVYAEDSEELFLEEEFDDFAVDEAVEDMEDLQDITEEVMDADKIPATVKLEKTSYYYTGRNITPKLVIKDSNNRIVSSTNYTVKYPAASKTPGKYTVTVTFKNKFSGIKKLGFKVIPNKTSISSLTANNTDVTVKYAKQATQTTGYKIQYSKDKNFKSGNSLVTIKKNTTVSTTVKGLTKGSTYYFRIRTFKTVSSKDYNSGWSAVKSITISNSSVKPGDELTIDSISSKLKFNKKELLNYTSSSYKAVLDSKKVKAIAGTASSGAKGTLYLDSDKKAFAWLRKEGTSTNYQYSNGRYNMWITDSDTSRSYLCSYWPSGGEKGIVVNNVKYLFQKKDLIPINHFVKSTLKATVEALSPGLYSRLVDGKTLVAKNCRITMGSTTSSTGGPVKVVQFKFNSNVYFDIRETKSGSEISNVRAGFIMKKDSANAVSASTSGRDLMKAVSAVMSEGISANTEAAMDSLIDTGDVYAGVTEPIIDFEGELFEAVED